MPPQPRHIPAAVLDRRREFGVRLRELRTRADLTQEAVAARAGLQRPFYSGVERGQRNISLDRIISLAHALGVHQAELFTGDDSGQVRHAGEPDEVQQARREFGVRLRELRTRAGLTQEAVAVRAGLQRPFYSGVERGQRNVSLDRIISLAHALELAAEELFPRVPTS